LRLFFDKNPRNAFGLPLLACESAVVDEILEELSLPESDISLDVSNPSDADCSPPPMLLLLEMWRGRPDEAIGADTFVSGRDGSVARPGRLLWLVKGGEPLSDTVRDRPEVDARVLVREGRAPTGRGGVALASYGNVDATASMAWVSEPG